MRDVMIHATPDIDPPRVSVTLADDGVAEVRLTRGDKMNALDPAMFAALLAAGEALQHQPLLRAVVLSGEGRAFCAGLDVEGFARMASSSDSSPISQALPVRTHGIANAAQQIAMVWRELPVPVIAAVHGVAFGGGLQVALGADIRCVAADARLCVMEIKWGLVPDMAGILLMTQLARPDVVRELTFTGRIFSGAEAVQLGLATRVSADPHAEAFALAREIAGKSPEAIRAAKRLLNLALPHDAAGVLLAESIEQQRLMGSTQQTEAVRANTERRAPVFGASR